MQRVKGHVFCALAAVLPIMLTATLWGCGAQRNPNEGAVDTAPRVTGTNQITTRLPDDSILLFQDNEGGAALIAAMNDGQIPLEAYAMYDEMGSRPEVTLTDQELIIALYNYLAHVRVPGEPGMYVTDCYHYVGFKLQDETYVTFRFEDSNLVWGPENYAIEDDGALWSYIRALQDEIMNERGDGPANMAEQHIPPFGLSGTVTMAEYMHECYSSFDKFDQGIQTGTSIPESVSLYAEGATQGTITDEAAIVELWNALSEVRIDLEHRQDWSYEGQYISFSFDSGRELIPFPFSTVELAKFVNDEVYPVENPDEVERLMARFLELAAADEAAG